MRRGFNGLLAAQAISLVGSRMSMLALPWFVLATTGSAAKTGLVAFAEMLPYVLACALGGPLLDRIGPRRAAIAADLASAAAVAAIPLLYRAGGGIDGGTGLSFTALVVLVAVTGALRGGGDLSKRVLFPRTAKAAGVDMTRAAALNDGVSRLATLLGAPIGGVLIAALGASQVLLVDAASFVVGAALIAVFVPRPVSTVEGPAPEPYFRAIRGGLAFLRHDRLIAAMVAVFFATNLFDSAYVSVLIPVWAARLGQPVALGLVSGCFALGAVLGNVVFTALAPRVPRYAVFTLGFLIGGAPRFAAAAIADQTWIVFVVSFVAGLGMAAVNPIAGAFFYERVPEHLMARVQGITTALGWGGIPLGALLGGAAAQGLGIDAALLAFGAAYLIVTLSPLIWRGWRQLDRPSPVDTSPVPLRAVDAH